MSKRIFANYNWTPGTTADGTALTSAQYMSIRGGSASQILDILEVYVNGLAGTAAPMTLCLARSVTAVATTPTALAAPASDGPMHPSVAALALPPVTFTAAATGSQRSAATTDARLNMGINAFGGSYRWNAAPTQQWTVLGNAVGGGETIFSNLPFGTPGALGCEIMYEPY